MGKATRWLRSLLRSKKSSSKKNNYYDNSKSADKLTNDNPSSSPYDDEVRANKHAIAVAAATAAVAEAALAAAHAASEVARLTGDRRAVLAVVKIQSAFRAYLARKALRALKGLVKLQALFRGHIVRKQSKDMLHRMQTMARIQARASVHRSESSNAMIKSSNSRYPQNRSRYLVGNKVSPGDEERCDRILEIDTWKPLRKTSQYLSTRNNRSYNNHTRSSPLSRLSPKPDPSVSLDEVSSVTSSKFLHEGDEFSAWTFYNSPTLHSASSRPSSNLRGPFTPTRSECSKSMFGDCPSYMANTQSSRSKSRSSSTPKQRVEFEELGWGAKFNQRLWESTEFVPVKKGSALPPNNRSKKYIHSGTTKRQGSLSSLSGHIL